MTEANSKQDLEVVKDDNVEVNKVSIRAPPFWKPNPAIWFCQIESQFATNGIKSDETKFNTVVGAIESNVLALVSDIVLNPPAQNKYETLKKRLQSHFSDSDEERLKKLLTKVQLGDNKPSFLLRQMKELAGERMDEKVIRTLWLQRLPVQAQTILAVSEDNLDKLATMADKICEVTLNNQVYTIESQGKKPNDIVSTTSLEEKINQLSKQVASLLKDRSRNRSRSIGSRTCSTSRNKFDANSTNCYYHNKFGENAKKCRPPCTFNNQKETKN